MRPKRPREDDVCKAAEKKAWLDDLIKKYRFKNEGRFDNGRDGPTTLLTTTPINSKAVKEVARRDSSGFSSMGSSRMSCEPR